jgi:predicted enzyme related to lactoylglutathione lyase
MPTKPAQFVWYDVMTSDKKAAGEFYKKAVGWTTQESPEHDYTVLSAGQTMVGGIMAIPDEAKKNGVPPCWNGYVGVPDVDDYAERVKKAGGAVRRPPADIPHVGRFAVVADPTGGVFNLFKGSSDMEPTPAAPETAGHIGWHELHAGDANKALAFYSQLFGWTKTHSMDMGPMGEYILFAAGGPDIGGILTKPPQMPRVGWLYYFNVEAIDAAAGRASGAGGKVVNGPMEVPGGHWIVQCVDPQGAMFAMVAPKK